MTTKTIILGAGIAGLGAAHTCKKRGEAPVVLEKDDTFGGLCGCFSVEGFTFDRFVHFSFAKEKEVVEIFNASAGEVISHVPNPYNIYNRKWIKHPAQNNLYPLDESEKKLIIDDFLARPKDVDMARIGNYEQWLRVQFGDYFAEHFPMVYTRKYWMCEAKDLETMWVGQRVYQPSVEEVIRGSKTADTPVAYYAKEMRYPRRGGGISSSSSPWRRTRIYAMAIKWCPSTRESVRSSRRTVTSTRTISSIHPSPCLSTATSFGTYRRTWQWQWAGCDARRATTYRWR